MRLGLATIALFCALAPAGAAEGWVFRSDANGGGSAGFAVDGAFRGLWLSCGGGAGTALVVSTGGTALQNGVDQTAVVTVDGIAFLQRMRASGAGTSGPTLRRVLPLPEFRDLAARLGKGRAAEVAMPAGRFALPLGGSGRAVQSLLATCG